MRPFNILIVGFCFFIGSTLVCRAEQPPCVGDRHDDCVATTTTTLPGDPAVECPEPAPCQPVTCVCDSSGGAQTGTVSITVNRCPDVVFPKFAPCRERANGKAHTGDVIFQGRPYKCPRKATPHRYFIPLP